MSQCVWKLDRNKKIQNWSSSSLHWYKGRNSPEPAIYIFWIESYNSLNPILRPNLWPNSDDSLCHLMTAARYSAQLNELDPMKIKPTLVGFSGE